MIYHSHDIALKFGGEAVGRIAALRDSDPAATVLKVFNKDGAEPVETRVVGGAVRSALAGSAPADVDCATTAPPQRVMDIAAQAGLHAIPTGIDHGTVTVVVDGKPVEITTLRTDVETHGRHATVAFGSDWLADAARRDFTVNAFYLDAHGHVHDPVGGAADITARRIRFIGSPAARIAEDYLRILRFFRFVASFEASADHEALSAIVAGRTGLRQLSAERVRKELLALLAAGDPVRSLTLMQSRGLLADILGSAPSVPRLQRLMELEARLGAAPDAIMRLAALGLHVREDAGRLGARLRLANAEERRLADMADAWWRIAPGRGEHALKTAIYRLGPQVYRDRVVFAWLNCAMAEPDADWIDAIRLGGRWEVPAFPLSGRDLIAAGLRAGPEVGEALKRLEAMWIASGFAMSREALLSADCAR
ncbi:MAG: CCA tRNA nucleotidyltransferase [Rhodobiaceae bacterium]|nr:CCA tRNA nucleotidyltransferase [Rhodobiaceae bacterium]MCC0053432.1 CCA tRNA nucleotidyltransferase [Rhodobiaceae bacterium]